MHVDGLYRTTHGVVSGAGVKSRAAHRRGDFLGFYTGKIMSEGAFADAVVRRPHLQDVGFEIPRTARVVVRDRADDLIGFVNEPPANAEANVAAIALHLSTGNAIAYFAARTIPPHTELWVHYGEKARRRYAAGRPASEPRRIQRADAVLSPRRMRRFERRYCARRTAAD